MKKQQIISALAFAAVVVAASSCNKNDSVKTTPKTNDTTVTPTTSSPSAPSPSVGNVDGAFVSLQVATATTTAGYTVNVTVESALATVFSATGSSTYVDAGAISVNSHSLTKQSNNSYLATVTPGMTTTDLGFSSGSNWSIAGAGSVAGFTYNHTVTFPDFSGTIPESVTRSSGVTVTFSGTITNADSVIVMVAQGSNSVLKTFAGTATSGTLTSSDLSVLAAVTDKSAIMEVVPYRVTKTTQGTKTYAFIKEHAFTKSINIQ